MTVNMGLKKLEVYVLYNFLLKVLNQVILPEMFLGTSVNQTRAADKRFWPFGLHCLPESGG